MQTRKFFSQILAGAGIFLAGVVSAQTWLATPFVTAQPPQTTPTTPKAFLAADERTEPVIREILVVIKKMDQRLENIEKSVTGGKKSPEGNDVNSRTRPR